MSGSRKCKNVCAAKAHKAACGATADAHAMTNLECMLGMIVTSVVGAAFVPNSRDNGCNASVGNAPSGALPLCCSH